jgi:hypothetical protein
MPIKSVDALIAALGRHQLLRPEHLHQVAQDLRPHYPDADTLAAELVRRGWVTEYTADMLLGRSKPPSHAKLLARFSAGLDDRRATSRPAFHRSIARQLGTFVIVSLIGLVLHLVLAVPAGWSAFWGFVLYRVAWCPFDLIDRSCAGCGCAFFSVTAVTTFVLNWLLGQPFAEAFGWGGPARPGSRHHWLRANRRLRHA